MKRLSRFVLALALLIPPAGLLTGCGQEASKQERAAEDNSYEFVENGNAARDVPDASSPDEQKAAEEPVVAAPDIEVTAPESEGPAAMAEPAPVPPSQPAPTATPGTDDGGPDGTGEEGGRSSDRGLGQNGQGNPAAGSSDPAGSGGHEAAEAAPPPPPPQPDTKFDVIPVFYGTDRAEEPDPKRIQFGAERGRKLQLGRALVTVPLAHKVPNIERPWVIEIPYFKVKIYEEQEDATKHFTLQEISALTKEQMLALIKERLAKSVNFKDHAFVFVHGFNTSFDYALYRTAQIAYDMKFDGAPFVYSWPSGGKVASYTYDRGSAEQAEPYLAEFLNLVIKESGAKSISLIAHSMGNELLLRVLERLRPSTPEGVTISQVIFAAPDVDRDKFMNIAREITNFAKGVTLYAASNDKALGYSARFWGGIPRAGDVPNGVPLIVPGVDSIDVSAVSTDSLGLNHSGYAENNALLNDIKLLLQTGERPPDKRVPSLQHLTTAEGGEYWRYPLAK